jgi:hypothetical protein
MAQARVQSFSKLIAKKTTKLTACPISFYKERILGSQGTDLM